MQTEDTLVLSGTEILITYKVEKSKSIALVEKLKFSSSIADITEIHESIGAFICKKYSLSPLKLLLFIMVDNGWELLEFTEFYIDKCRIHRKTKIEQTELDKYFN